MSQPSSDTIPPQVGGPRVYLTPLDPMDRSRQEWQVPPPPPEEEEDQLPETD